MSKKNVLYSNLDSSCIKLICSKILNTDDSQRAIARQANVSARTVRRFAERLKKTRDHKIFRDCGINTIGGLQEALR